MSNYIETKVTHCATQEDGREKKVSDLYLVDAMTFTEAEQRIAEEVAPYISGEFEVKSVKKSNITELHTTTDEEADRYFKLKCQYITLDERTGKEKKTNSYHLVQARSIEDAISRYKQSMKDCLVDYVIASIAETMILDVYLYKPSEKQHRRSLLRFRHRG